MSTACAANGYHHTDVLQSRSVTWPQRRHRRCTVRALSRRNVDWRRKSTAPQSLISLPTTSPGLRIVVAGRSGAVARAGRARSVSRRRGRPAWRGRALTTSDSSAAPSSRSTDGRALGDRVDEAQPERVPREVEPLDERDGERQARVPPTAPRTRARRCRGGATRRRAARRSQALHPDHRVAGDERRELGFRERRRCRPAARGARGSAPRRSSPTRGSRRRRGWRAHLGEQRPRFAHRTRRGRPAPCTRRAAGRAWATGSTSTTCRRRGCARPGVFSTTTMWSPSGPPKPSSAMAAVPSVEQARLVVGIDPGAGDDLGAVERTEVVLEVRRRSRRASRCRTSLAR